MRGIRSAIAFGIASFICVGPFLSAASGSRLTVEWIDTRTCADRGAVTVWASEVELSGTPRSIDLEHVSLTVDGMRSKARAVGVTSLDDSSRSVHVAIVAQSNLSYLNDMALIRDGIIDFIAALPSDTTFTVIGYSWRPHLLGEALPSEAARVAVGRLVVQEEAGSVALIPALDFAVRLLKKSKVGTRRILMTIADGLNQDLSRDEFRRFAARATAANVFVYPIAFSATDERNPLRNLGEIAKRTLGTFRWARVPSDLHRQFMTLSSEIGQQLGFTFSMPDRCAHAHRVQLVHHGLRSNVVGIAPVMVAEVGEVPGAHSGAMNLWWLALVGSIVFSAGVWLFRKRAAVRSHDRPLLSIRVLSEAGGETVALREGRTRIGSAVSCGIRLPPESKNAPYHAELNVDGDHLTIVDLASPAGTLVNGTRCTEMRLKAGDRITCGTVDLVVGSS